MNRGLKIIALLLCFSSFAQNSTNYARQTEQFSSELLELKEYFKIPGLAVSIDKKGETIYREYLGVSDLEKSTIVNESTLFPIASITKVFSGVLIMKLIEQGKLSLDAPINTFLPRPILNDSILVKHILSHTSQGNVGQEFYYSSRFGLLTNVIERASGMTFSEAMELEIFEPLQLKNTFLLKDSTQTKKIAKPYILDNGLETGFIDYGYSSSAGIVSNLDDLSIFNNALDNNSIITKRSRDLMFSTFGNDLPYGYGIFNQQIEGFNIVWAYGQYDCYSSLFLKIPSENITLTILANSSMLSDPARLIYGNAHSSLFVISFLKNYVLELTAMPLFELNNSEFQTYPNKEFYRKKLLAEALAESYMSRYEPEKLQSSAKLLKLVFSEYSDYLAYADLTLLHNLSFLKDVAFYMELGAFNDFDIQLEAIGQMLLTKEPNNPYTHIYLGTFYARNGQNAKAMYHFERIVNAKNFSKNWYTNEALQWLKDN